MLGRKISDPEQTEAAGISECEGIGLLGHETVFCREKTQRQAEGVLQGISGMFSGLNGLHYNGYEIHMGQSSQPELPIVNTGNIYGTYIHGIFDEGNISETIVRSLCINKGIWFDPSAVLDRDDYKNQQYEVLADAVRNNLDMDFVYKIMN